jgi:hypothetical protein
MPAETGESAQTEGGGWGTVPVAGKEARAGTDGGHAHWLVLLLVAIFILLALSFLWLHVTTPFDGARLQPGEDAVTAEGVIVTPVEEGTGALEDGDLVVSVAGRRMTA